jgi:DNA-binding transcriptional MerR regulator
MKQEYYMTIGDFARIVFISRYSLRAYDKEGIFTPAARGNGSKNGYRYYSPTQITTVKMIRVLVRLEVPHRTIRELAESRTPEKMIRLLRRQKEELAGEIRFRREAHSLISMLVDFMTEGLLADESEMFVRECPERQAYFIAHLGERRAKVQRQARFAAAAFLVADGIGYAHSFALSFRFF